MSISRGVRQMEGFSAAVRPHILDRPLQDGDGWCASRHSGRWSSWLQPSWRRPRRPAPGLSWKGRL